MQRPQNKPYFYDITLRDGNQSLKKPWSLAEKLQVFDSVTSLGIKAVEIGFPASSKMDFEACTKLADRAPQDVIRAILTGLYKQLSMLNCQEFIPSLPYPLSIWKMF